MRDTCAGCYTPCPSPAERSPERAAAAYQKTAYNEVLKKGGGDSVQETTSHLSLVESPAHAAFY